MAVNHNSGRVVIDIGPELKHALHASLAADGSSLKDWFVRHANEYIRERRQPQLAFAAEPPSPAYGVNR